MVQFLCQLGAIKRKPCTRPPPQLACLALSDWLLAAFLFPQDDAKPLSDKRLAWNFTRCEQSGLSIALLEQRKETTVMKKLIVLTSAAVIAFWGQGLMAQAADPAPAANQTQVQKRDRIHTPGTGQQQAANKAQQQNQNGQKAAKQKKGKQAGPADGTGNQGSRPQDGTGWGAQSGNRTGPTDGTGSRMGGANSSQRGSMGGGRAGGRGGRR
jgi:hypothetical protein